MTRPIFSPLFAFVFLMMLLPRAADAQSVRAYVNVDSISVGERIGFTIAVERSQDIDVTFPELRPDTLGRFLQFGDLLLVAETRTGIREVSEGLSVDSIVYEATTFALDTMRAAGIPVLFATSSDTLVATTDPFFVPVRSIVPADAEDIMDLLPIAEFPAPIWPWLLLIALLLAATAAFIFWSRRAPKAVVLAKDHMHASLPPHEEARLRLATLAEVSVDADEKAEMFCVELSDILRTYLYRRTSVHALEMTTGELADRLKVMEADGAVPTETCVVVDTVLQICDLAKFAEIFPEDSECHRHADAVGSMVSDVEAFLLAATAPPDEAPVFDDDLEHPEELVTEKTDESAH